MERGMSIIVNFYFRSVVNIFAYILMIYLYI